MIISMLDEADIRAGDMFSHNGEIYLVLKKLNSIHYKIVVLSSCKNFPKAGATFSVSDYFFKFMEHHK